MKTSDDINKYITYVNLSTEESFTKNDFSAGRHSVILTVTDDKNISSTDKISIFVSTIPAPTANAGSDKKIYYTDSITLDASSSTDNSAIVSYEWKDGSTLLSNDISFTKTDFSVGTHNIILTVTNDGGKSSTDSVVVTVFDTFTNILPMREVGAKIVSSSTINSTTTTSLAAGSESYFQIANNTDREFTITKFEIISTYNGINTTRVSSSNITSILGYDKLSVGASPSLGYILKVAETANYWTGRFYLTDDATGETFTNSYKWDGSTFN